MKPKKLSGPRPEPVDALVYPRFSGLTTFMRLPHVPRAQELDIALIGIPFDGGTTYRSGPRFGPRHVREQSAIIRPWNPVLNVNPFAHWRIADYGDLSINPLSLDDTYKRITNQLSEVADAGARAICVGGDHSILLPILRAVHRKFGPVALVQFDAHNDTWGGYFGRQHSTSGAPRAGLFEGRLRFRPPPQVQRHHRGGVSSSGPRSGRESSEAFSRQTPLPDTRHRCGRSGLRAGNGHPAGGWALKFPDPRTVALPQRAKFC